MFRTRAGGSASMSVAWARETKAPVAGLPIRRATSSSQNPPAAAVSAAEPAKARPPAAMRRRRRDVSPAAPSSGSRRLPTKPGTASTAPISA
jgi:hypothetical protein